MTIAPDFADGDIASALIDAAMTHGDSVRSKAAWQCELVGTLDSGSLLAILTTRDATETLWHFIVEIGDWGVTTERKGPFREHLPTLPEVVGDGGSLSLDEDYWVSCTTSWAAPLTTFGSSWEQSGLARPKRILWSDGLVQDAPALVADD